MNIEVKIPKIAESVSSAYLSQWYKQDGEMVTATTPILSLETDKISFEVKAPTQGILHIAVPSGQTVEIGTVVAHITESNIVDVHQETTRLPQDKLTQPMPIITSNQEKTLIIAPSARKLLEKYNIAVEQVQGTGPGGRITKGDVLLYLENTSVSKNSFATTEKIPSTMLENAPNSVEKLPPTMLENRPNPDVLSYIQTSITTKVSQLPEETVRKQMPPIRAKIAEHLLHAKHSTAMLTTFNEVDMTRIIELRSQYKEIFQQKYKIHLGFMPFFIRATIAGLKEYPQLNAYLDGKDIVFHHYYHIGIAVGGERGLVVPVIRHADHLSFVELEQVIQAYIEKVKQNALTLQDLEGGTFTISNGGVYGSLLSTPILNTPQVGILGMHKIQDRAVVWNGQITIRPMMYLALSYDHCIIDGRESVNFLKRIKECLENPERMMMEI